MVYACALLPMLLLQALASITAGVVSAGAIMTALTLAGKAGAVAATVVLALFCLSQLQKKTSSSSSSSSSDAPK
jgi:hypothetical protein